MSLVAYGSSDESDEENKNNKPVKKQKETVKITIPCLKEFQDEEDEKPVTKRPKLQSGSGLFSLLPPPKNSPSVERTGLVPHILLSKKEKALNSTQNKKQDTTISTPSKITQSLTPAISTNEEHESDDECVSAKGDSNTTVSHDFFWLDDLASKNETVIENPVSISSKNTDFLQDLSSQLPNSSSSNNSQAFSKYKEENVHLEQQPPAINEFQVEGSANYISSEQQWHSVDVNYSSNSSSDSKETLLKDEQFLKLQGRRREFENIDIIDVKADDQLTDRNEWLMKSVTEETTHRPKKKHGLPTQQQKRKHQITYLAFQAKEREMDLKNQWALNRLTRRETQSKYGF